ncbi:MAG: saccharopine dehydrogenase (NAD+, L-lysine-forming), partial [Cyclobacteriaceae bacterium]
MSKVVIIGAGGVGRVVAYKCAQHSEIFSEIVLASRTKSKCDIIASDIERELNIHIKTDQVDADHTDQI